ncbi:MAG: winged helix-turn-helix domain-containing protein [Zoogloeaceae bacterium]|uniref:winged helix-turn-helix domain-containing protein n=1 Tax=Denitromonas sp. TaxID=2734609 RepID=UPI001D8BC694|nr:winged helix-turn-helix domain-containing protein [Rhodocyclaceae bacterium]MCP5220474.1 winged helix-turn-helix domain-containing protein [Zoogloeaceae bacterium]HPR06560.1 winged helix-turn-helix domain-containing protein [Denitromonas sp.]
MTARLRHQVRIMLDDKIALGPGKATLLEAIGRHGSISAAAREMGMSYTRAWALVDAMNRCFRQPVVLTVTGGKRGGGAEVSATGYEVLRQYRAMEKAANAALDGPFDELRPLLRDQAEHPDDKA